MTGLTRSPTSGLSTKQQSGLYDGGNAILGFYLNGSKNLKWKAACARVTAGSGRGLIVQKGDSTTVGQGAGSTADSYGLTGARANRIASVLSSLFTASGLPMLDGGIVSDNGMWVANNFILPTYDSRVGAITSWGITPGQTFAGGGYLEPASGTGLSFTPTSPVDTFEFVYYNSNTCTYTFLIDGGAPSSGPASVSSVASTGELKVTLKAASVGIHTLTISANNNFGASRSIKAYNSSVPAIDILCHAALGATSANQSATGSSWSNNDSLAFDSPDLTTINLGLNDMKGSVATATTISNLQAIITQAKVSGDVLLMCPTPASGGYNSSIDALNVALKALAISNGIAYFSLYEYYGPFNANFATRLFDGILHPKAPLYAEIAGLIQRALTAMSV